MASAYVIEPRAVRYPEYMYMWPQAPQAGGNFMIAEIGLKWDPDWLS